MVRSKKEKQLGQVCDMCKTSSILESLLVVYEYHNPIVERIIYSMKYRGAYDIARTMGEIMAQEISSCIDLDGGQHIVIPMPLHGARERERGFNQSEVLAKVLSRRWGLDCERRSLIRIKNTDHQARLAPHERISNIRGAFAVKNQESVRGRSVLLVDDVCTTGATL